MIELLTPRCKEVLELSSQGYSVKELAKILYVSKFTIRSHLHEIYSVMNIDNVDNSVRKTIAILMYLKEKGVLPADFKIRGEYDR